ncbi:CNOT8 [Hepatospora eriocheir]|uniref:poly(A)-specific ribonuclease n=1 Tax=Hepatospora eriocheir TaxID=1081669 RepID=A0A1X0QB75_9MICR|nr:CNOT8 [Hepatospora eriocheir]ORD99125.1 CNOT8 [Hepatospora eriocheir]
MKEREFIKNVWMDNLEAEIDTIRHLAKTYSFIAMDTEFPGVVAKPIGNLNKDTTYAYQQLRCNVDILNLIQLGISLSDANGNKPNGVHTWQFNLKFSLQSEMYSKESIELLHEAKIDFEKHSTMGIDPAELGYWLLTSGLVLTDDIYWISFHSSYDFAYLMKLLTGNTMPDKEADFYKLLKIFFPCFYDYKYLIKNSDYMKKGLQEIGTYLGVNREGIAHQAGSDALLTSAIFFKSINSFLSKEAISINMNKLFGIDASPESKNNE